MLRYGLIYFSIFSAFVNSSCLLLSGSPEEGNQKDYRECRVSRQEKTAAGALYAVGVLGGIPGSAECGEAELALCLSFHRNSGESVLAAELDLRVRGTKDEWYGGGWISAQEELATVLTGEGHGQTNSAY